MPAPSPVSPRFTILLEVNQDIYSDIVAQAIGAGLLLDGPSDFPVEVGDLLITLREKVGNVNNGKVRRDVYLCIVDTAASMVSMTDFSSRLRKAVGNLALSEALEDTSHLLAIPASAAKCFIEVTRTWGDIHSVKVHNRLPTNPSNAVCLPPPLYQSSPRPTWPSGLEKSNRDIAYLGAKQKNITSRHPTLSVSPRDYLPEEERDLGPRSMKPVQKHALALLRCVLHARVPDASANAYLIFGFAACADAAEGSALRDLYRAIFDDCDHKQATFRAFCQALSFEKLINFVAQHGYPVAVLDRISNAITFLRFAFKSRPTVYRLNQFQASNDTNPPPWLRRDFGFRYCKGRGGVHILKAVYRAALNKCTPLQLHAACTEGDIFTFVNQTGVYVENVYRRLMRNDSGNPSVGFEDGTVPKRIRESMVP